MDKHLPSPLDKRSHEQSNDAGADCTDYHPKDDEPGRGGRDDGGCQCWWDAQKLERLVGQQEGVVYAVAGLPTGRKKPN